ncbi:MAG: DegV family protein [Gammaproteobacteria bacterium]|nr:DegV family protein [Gammaproteobacteria bacterium]
MRVGLVIDSACDLPQKFIEDNNLEIMPINLVIGDEIFIDERNPEETIKFYKRYAEEKNLQGETQPFSVEQITRLFLDKLVLNYDRVLVVTIASSRSLIFENATKASFAILSGYKQKRAKAGIEGSFALRVVDSKTLFTGEAVLVKEAVRLMKEEDVAFDKLRPAVEALSKHVHAYLVPNDLHYLRKAGRARGDRSISWVSYTLGTALDIKPIAKAYRGDTFPIKKIAHFETAVNDRFEFAIEAIEKGLMTNTICMSYAGNPEVIREMAGYKKLKQVAERKGVELMLTVMSTTAGINVGPGAFAMGLISDKMGEND